MFPIPVSHCTAVIYLLLYAILVLGDDTALFRPFLALSSMWVDRVKVIVPRCSLTQCIVRCHKSPDCLILRHYEDTCEMAMRAAGYNPAILASSRVPDEKVEVYVRRDLSSPGERAQNELDCRGFKLYLSLSIWAKEPDYFMY